MANNTRLMPRHGDRGAPAFDGEGPALLRYFEDVEMCLEECAIATERMKKRYLYGDDAKTYTDFKNAVIGLFPGMEPERRYGVRDLEALVDLWEEKGIKAKAELGEFHQVFLRVSTFLMSKQRLSKPEIQRLYHRAYSKELRKQIVLRLCTVDQNHHQDDPFEVEEVFKAANFFLFGTQTGGPALGSSAARSSLGRTTSAAIKQEEVLMFQMLANLLKETITSVATAQAQSATMVSRQGPGRPMYQPPVGAVVPAAPFQSQRPNGCIFCGGNHFVCECQEAQTYIDKGLAGRNKRGKVCLPNGYFVPGYVQGATLKERIDNYHRMSVSGGSGVSGATAGSLKERDPPPHLSANLLELSEIQLTGSGGATIEEISDDEVELERLQAQVLAMEKKVAQKNKPQKKVTFDGVVIPVRPDGRKTRSTEGDTLGKGKEQSDPAPTKSATPARQAAWRAAI
ncbi:hypothetical protein SCHPADRAFT_947689 [Schizopora paradoxa]|uniref:Uncharacterized protein n=1 Tax=Schizopora paradoxa TaxID=27342 RepID=A0A0H2QZN4_9AGAM|nr:hypothetical protein SCHPADRAFT_947689 [Schizopora paradoxa]